MSQSDADAFWPLVKRYRSLGLDPLKWIAGCSVEVDRESVVYPALSAAREGFEAVATTIMPRQGPDVFELRDAPRELVRVVTRPGTAAPALRQPRRANPLRATMVGRFFEPRAESPELFGRALVEAVSRLPPAAGPLDLAGPLTLGSIHAVTTRHEDGQFASFELYSAGSGRARGHSAVSAESLQITDSTLDPLAEQHAAIVAASALSGLFALGVTEDLSLAPLFDAAGRKATDALASNFHAAAVGMGLRLLEREPIGTGKLFVGALVGGHTQRAVPNRHHYVKRGMQITLTRPFGELAPLATYLSCLSDADYSAKLGDAGLSMSSLSEASRETLRALAAPARGAGEVIAEFSPAFDEPPELQEHLAATVEVASRGVLAFADFARRLEVDVRIGRVPLSHEAVSDFATAAFLMDNATATSHGAIGIVAYPSVLDPIERALEEKGLQPTRVGEILGRGKGLVKVPRGTPSAIASKRLLREVVVDA